MKEAIEQKLFETFDLLWPRSCLEQFQKICWLQQL